MKPETVLHYATLAVPRYTSYPTAADFGPVSDAQRIEWLQKMRADQLVSLYIHIPYCHDICHYCGCHSKAAVRDDVVAAYGELIVQDIRQQALHMKFRPRVAHLHWGGGTPSILSRKSFEAIMDALHDCFDFCDDAEHAIELDPRTVTQPLVETLQKIGVNRASLGVQDINPKVQEAIGRIQPIQSVERAVSLLKNVGITRINFDLIYGLPLQTEQTIRETCESVGALKPDRVACYGYAHLPKRRANQKRIDASLLPGPMTRFKQSEVVGECFIKMGYEPIGIDHFARSDDPMAQATREGKLQRNFQGYTDDDCPVLIGFGCSSISQFHDGFAQTVADIGQYRRAITAGTLGTVRGIAVTDEDLLRRALISDLMCRFEVDLGHYGGRARYAHELRALQPIIEDGVALEQNGIIRMTAQGRPFVRAVATLFDTYRKQNSAQFSAAV